MQEIKFPELGIEIHISKIAIQIGKISIHWYAIFIVIAILTAILVCKKRDGLYNIKFETILDFLIYALPVALICARIYYVMFKLDNFRENPLRIFDLKMGGLAIYGGILGGAITCFAYCKIKKIHPLDLLDYIIPTVSLAQAIGRWGNFINVEAYGVQTKVLWRMGIIQNNQYIEVHPTFLYESIITFILSIYLINLQKKRKIRGEITFNYLIIYSFARIIIEGLRSDSLMLYNVKISQILSIAIFVVFCIILTYKKIKMNKIKTDSKK